MDFRLLDPNAAARGTAQVNQWADQYATRRAGRALADGDGIGATDILNRNGLMDQAQGVLDNEWKAQDREVAARTRAEQEAHRAEERRLAEEAREAEVLGNMATNLRGVMTSRGAEAVLPAFDMLAQTWLTQGADPEQIAQMRAGLETDPELFLTSVAGASDQALERYKFFQNGGSIFRADQLTGDAREVARGDRYEAVDPTRDLIRIPGMGPDGPSDLTGDRPAARPASVPADAEAIVGDRDTVIRTMLAEAQGEGPEGLAAVGAVMVNRASQTGKTAAEIAQERGQFEPHMTADGRARMARYQPGSPQWQMAEDALNRVLSGDDPTGGADHFYAPAAQRALGRDAPAWDDGSGTDLGGHRFFRLGYGGGSGAAPRTQQTPPPSGERPGGVEVVRPGRARPSSQFRAATAEELAGYPAGTAAQVDTTTGELKNIRTPPAARAAGAGGSGRLQQGEDLQLRQWRTEATQAQSAGNIYRQMLPLARTVDTGGMMAMPGAGTVRGAFDADTRRFMALTDQLTPAMRQGLPGAASDRDVAMFRSATPSIDKPRAANIAAIEAGVAWAQRQGDFVAFMENYANQNGTIRGGLEQWAEYTAAQPLFDEGAHGMPRVRRVIPWRQYFGQAAPARGGAAAPAPRTQAPPARSGGTPQRRRYNPSTGGFD